MASYYEELCKKKGIKIPSYVMAVRSAEKNDQRNSVQRIRAELVRTQTGN